jgi:hypothetical protein
MEAERDSTAGLTNVVSGDDRARPGAMTRAAGDYVYPRLTVLFFLAPQAVHRKTISSSVCVNMVGMIVSSFIDISHRAQTAGIGIPDRVGNAS